MGTTDVHGWLLPWDYAAGEPADQGLALLAPLVDSIRAANPGRTLLVDSGDLLQGSALAAAFTPLAQGEEHPVLTAMNLLGYDAAGVGNHEFNFGLEHLDRALANARFPFLSANVLEVGSGEPAFPQYVLLEREVEGVPVRIGVTAVLPPGVAVWDRDHVEGRLLFPDIVDQLAEVVPRMRAEGAEVVVVAAHSSFEGTSYDTVATGLGGENRMAEAARQVPGIDVIFLGHSHREVADSILNDVLFLQAGPAERSRVQDGPLLDFVNEVQRKVSGARLSAAASFSLEAGLPGPELRAYLEHSARYFLPCPGGECEQLINPEWPGYNFDVISGVEYTLDLREPVGEGAFPGSPERRWSTRDGRASGTSSSGRSRRWG